MSHKYVLNLNFDFLSFWIVSAFGNRCLKICCRFEEQALGASRHITSVGFSSRKNFETITRA